jgi:hypothetical protein
MELSYSSPPVSSGESEDVADEKELDELYKYINKVCSDWESRIGEGEELYSMATEVNSLFLIAHSTLD